MKEIFESTTNSSESLAGVFEFDGETSYFYLYKIDDINGNKIIDAIYIGSEKPNFNEKDVAITWDAEEKIVGLIIKEKVLAIFDCQNEKKYGGKSKDSNEITIPETLMKSILNSRYNS